MRVNSFAGQASRPTQRGQVETWLIRRKLKTKMLSVAKLRLDDLEAEELKKVEHQLEATDGKMTFADAVATYRLSFSKIVEQGAPQVFSAAPDWQRDQYNKKAGIGFRPL